MTNSQHKGKRGQLEVAKQLSEELGIAIKKILDQVSQRSGHDLTIPGYAVEVKRGENISLPAAIRQVTRSALAAGIDNWAVVYRANNSPWRVVLSTDIEGLATLSREEIKLDQAFPQGDKWEVSGPEYIFWENSGGE